MESTTHGLNLAGRGLPLEPGSQVLVGEMEFLQVAMPWVMMKEKGIEVLQVAAPGGRVLPEVYEKYITPKTRLIALSSTSWNNGFRCDMQAFSELCRKHNLYLVVDAIQNLGAVRFYPDELDIDMMVAGGHKWLNAPYGCGIMYISPRVIDAIKPTDWGYLNLEDPEGGWVPISPVRIRLGSALTKNITSPGWGRKWKLADKQLSGRHRSGSQPEAGL